MRLTLSSETVRNAVFTNESGQVLYKTSHPFKLGTLGKTIIHKIVPNADPTDVRDKFEVTGEIDWHFVGSSTFRINGQETKASDFLPRHGITGSTRKFTGPDGRQYRWDVVLDSVAMSRDDKSKTEVARYHRPTLGIIGPKKEPCLDVDPDVMDMLDLVVLTFVYMEKLRMEIERTAYHSSVNI